MDVYKEWNFKENPFQTTSLPPLDIGKQLLAGRDHEIRRLLVRLYNQPQIVTVEGLNGVGKTSLINVSIFNALERYMNDKQNQPLFIPCARAFQLDKEANAEEFLDEVLIEIAQTFIRHAEDLEKLGITMPANLNEVNKWLNSSVIDSYQATIGGFGFGKTVEANVSTGFEKSGFRRIIRSWLEQIFPKPNSGGIVCIIDNLELLEQSGAARRAIESLRDTLFAFPGIRWVLCGSLGIITSLVASPRLEGMLHDPIEVKGVELKFLRDIFEKRMIAYRQNNDYYVPLCSRSFSRLYQILDHNIRNTLKYSNDYCLWVFDRGTEPKSIEEKEELFAAWLKEKSADSYASIRRFVKTASLDVFKMAIDYGGIFSLTDYEYFDFDTSASFKTCINDLEASGLLISVIDDSDKRRKSIQVTPKGWFVSHALATT